MAIKILALVCQACGAELPGDYKQEWGRKYGDGLGPRPRCHALVYAEAAPRDPKHPDEKPLAVCGSTDLTPVVV